MAKSISPCAAGMANTATNRRWPWRARQRHHCDLCAPRPCAVLRSKVRWSEWSTSIWCSAPCFLVCSPAYVLPATWILVKILTRDLHFFNDACSLLYMDRTILFAAIDLSPQIRNGSRLTSFFSGSPSSEGSAPPTYSYFTWDTT